MKPVPRVSVLLRVPPAADQSAIAASLACIQNQSLRDCEVLVIGSSAADGVELNTAAAQDRRIRLLQQVEGGRAHAWNAGLAAARGLHIAFLEPGCVWQPTFLERLEQAALRSGADVAYCGWTTAAGTAALPVDAAQGDLPRLLLGDELWPLSASLSAHTALARIGGFDPVLEWWADYDLWLRLSPGLSVVRHAEALLVPGTAGTGPGLAGGSAQAWLELVAVRERFLQAQPELTGRLGDTVVKQITLEPLRQAARAFLDQDEAAEARQIYSELLRRGVLELHELLPWCAAWSPPWLRPLLHGMNTLIPGAPTGDTWAGRKP